MMELFDFTETDNSLVMADIAAIDQLLDKLDEVSTNARDNAAHALLYGFSEHGPANPPLGAIRRFLQKVLNAAKKAENAASEEGRRLAEQARSDRLDPDTEQVEAAAFKVVREFDRLRGILRFKPAYDAAKNETEQNCCYTARCSPDHFVLPLLADHFWQRFGQQSWAVIDERRRLVLFSADGKEPVLRPLKENSKDKKPESDEWEGLWKNYHCSINNEERSNPKLQKQFLPGRYRKYLTEME